MKITKHIVINKDTDFAKMQEDLFAQGYGWNHGGQKVYQAVYEFPFELQLWDDMTITNSSRHFDQPNE